MPYTHKKEGNKYVVYKKGKKVGETEGTKTALNKYLAALHIADKPKKENINEDMTYEHWDHPGCEDKIGKIFVVLKPGPQSQPEDLVHQTHAFGMGQFEPQGVHGVYNDESEAGLVAEAACNELHKHLAEVEHKKHTVVEKIDKHIARLQKEINAHMKEASDIPENADKAHALAEDKMNLIKELRAKRKIVEASKKPVEKLEEGFFDRMTAKLKGAGAQAKTTYKNLGAFMRGDKEAIQDPKLARSVAMLKQKASTLKKNLDEMQRDLEKLFPPDVVAKLPAEFAKPFANYVKSIQSAKAYNDGFATGNLEAGGTSNLTARKQPVKKKPGAVVQMGVA